MNSPLRLAYKKTLHFLRARHSRGHGVHSPFVFHFTRFVIYEKNPFYVFSVIEKLRKDLKKDNRKIQVTDYGMGKSGTRFVRDIAAKSLKKPKYAQLMFRIAKHHNAENILELGTSLGITTAYLASSNDTCQCTTLEGCPEIARIAQENFDRLNLKNIEIVVGDIAKKLPKVLEKSKPFDFIFIDANHRSEAVLSYFKQCLSNINDHTVLIVDDIYWSADMEYAWKTIKKSDKVTATIDLFELGIVFFNPILHKKEYKMHL